MKFFGKKRILMKWDKSFKHIIRKIKFTIAEYFLIFIQWHRIPTWLDCTSNGTRGELAEKQRGQVICRGTQFLKDKDNIEYPILFFCSNGALQFSCLGLIVFVDLKNSSKKIRTCKKLHFPLVAQNFRKCRYNFFLHLFWLFSRLSKIVFFLWIINILTSEARHNFVKSSVFLLFKEQNSYFGKIFFSLHSKAMNCVFCKECKSYTGCPRNIWSIEIYTYLLALFSEDSFKNKVYGW